MSDLVTHSDLHARIHPVRQPALTVNADGAAALAAAATQGQINSVNTTTPMLAIMSSTVARVSVRPVTAANGPDKKSVVRIYLTSNDTITAVEPASGGGTVLHKVGLGGLNVCAVVRPDPTTGLVKIEATTAAGSVVSATVEHRGYSTATNEVTLS